MSEFENSDSFLTELEEMNIKNKIVNVYNYDTLNFSEKNTGWAAEDWMRDGITDPLGMGTTGCKDNVINFLESRDGNFLGTNNDLINKHPITLIDFIMHNRFFHRRKYLEFKYFLNAIDTTFYGMFEGDGKFTLPYVVSSYIDNLIDYINEGNIELCKLVEEFSYMGCYVNEKGQKDDTPENIQRVSAPSQEIIDKMRFVQAYRYNISDTPEGDILEAIRFKFDCSLINFASNWYSKKESWAEYVDSGEYIRFSKSYMDNDTKAEQEFKGIGGKLFDPMSVIYVQQAKKWGMLDILGIDFDAGYRPTKRTDEELLKLSSM